MSRRRLAWLLTLPLATLGSQLAHAVAYRLAAPGDENRAHELAASHGYLAYAPVALAVGAALVALGLVHELRVVLAGRAATPSRPSALGFAVLAPAVFAGQELFERLLHDGTFPWLLVLEPTFSLGLILQLPFALAAFAVARLLLRAARAVARLLTSPPATAHRRRSRWPSRSERVLLSLPSGLALGPRGPPAILAV